MESMARSIKNNAKLRKIGSGKALSGKSLYGSSLKIGFNSFA
jgi:hypothetical protein